MADSGDKIKKTGRKTISLKREVGPQFSKASSAGKTIEVEIKRKRHGLVTNDSSKDSAPSESKAFESKGNFGKLTDQEFQARVKALKEAMKEEPGFDVEEQAEAPVVEAEAPVEVEKAENVKNEPEVEIEVAQPEVETKEEMVEQKKEQPAPQPKKVEKPEKVEPVVFKSSEYIRKKPEKKVQNKPSAKPEKQPQQQQKQRQTPPPALENMPNKAVPSRQRFNPENSEDSNSRKKQKIVVRERSFGSRRLSSSGKVSRAVLDRVLNNDLEERVRSEASVKRARMKLKNAGNKEFEATKVVREVQIPDSITVAELANRMAVRAAEVVKYLMNIGTIATVNETIDGDTAEIICSEFGHTPKRVSDSDVENELENIIDDEKDLKPRAPIVAIMGHVDHGKTTLLDTIRKTNVAQKEAGGITQHVAAYQIETKQGKKITFIDTPGHAAFSNIRKRGAVITDIIVLVAAADDGIKEQTIEVINQAKSQNVPLIVAINKVDKPNINIDRVKTELMSQEVVLEDFGGDVLSAEISALKGINIDGLLETILLQAEMLELKANPNRKAVGTILESRVDKGRGIVSSVIVQHGTIKTGDIFVSGAAFGKVRMIFDDKGKKLDQAGPATPVEIVGFDSSPEPGDILSVVDTEQKAKEIAEYRKEKQHKGVTKSTKKSFEQMISSQDSNIKKLDIVVKADVFGSLEALVASIEFIQHPEIKVEVIEKGVGAVNESDVDFAKNTGAIIVGFNVNITSAAKSSAKLNNVTILQQSVIYHITEEIKKIMSGMLSPIVEERYAGTADVRKIFLISRFGTIAGCYVSDGVIKRNDSKIKVFRGNNMLFEGKIRSMKHEKDEIKEARQNYECGILADGYNDFKEGDRIECYEIVLKQRSVD